MSPSPSSRLRRSRAMSAITAVRSSLRCSAPSGRRRRSADGAASHTETVSFAVPARAPGRELALLDRLEPASSSQCADLPGREAEPLVRVLLAQELELVRCEIDDQQPAARRQHARRLAHGALPDRTGSAAPGASTTASARLVGKRQIVDVAVAHLRACRARRLRQVAAGVGQHGVVEVEAEAALVALARTARACAPSRCRDRSAARTARGPAPPTIASSTSPRPHAARECGPIRRRAHWK